MSNYNDYLSHGDDHAYRLQVREGLCNENRMAVNEQPAWAKQRLTRLATCVRSLVKLRRADTRSVFKNESMTIKTSGGDK